MKRKFPLKLFKCLLLSTVFLMHFSYAVFWPLKYTLKLVLTSGKQNLSTIFQFFVPVFIIISSYYLKSYKQVWCGHKNVLPNDLGANLWLRCSAEIIAAQQIEQIRSQAVNFIKMLFPFAYHLKEVKKKAKKLFQYDSEKWPLDRHAGLENELHVSRTHTVKYNAYKILHILWNKRSNMKVFVLKLRQSAMKMFLKLGKTLCVQVYLSMSLKIIIICCSNLFHWKHIWHPGSVSERCEIV